MEVNALLLSTCDFRFQIYICAMVVSVLAILETDFVHQKSLAKIMNERLERAAKELQQVHLKTLSGSGFSTDDLIVYLSYNPKFNSLSRSQ
ncbi:hypothetical protein [Pedobacter sp.]|uniref:hypothetical protein n=1 Tax=Pedobacter sp. TaxID=1411316 RepID=UPI003C77CF35